MGKVYNNKKCEICGAEGKVIEVWGRYYCRSCYEKKPKKGNGHSGMIRRPGALKQMILSFSNDITLQRVKKSDPIFSTLYLDHYPKSKGIVGRQLNYLIVRGNQILGIIGANSPPLNYKLFREYFGVDNDMVFLNNNVFRLIVHEKNLGTRVLKLFRNRIKKDYKSEYGDELIGLVTFVEPPRTGAVYKADNWDYLGMTEGKRCTRRGNLGKWINKEWTDGVRKHIFARRI